MRRASRIAFMLLLILFLLAAAGLGFLAATVAGMGEIPDIQTPLTSTFYDRNGEVISTRFEQNRIEIPLDVIPDHLEKAFVAVEDRRFYSHRGIDLQGLARAMFRNIRERRFVEGGSTITQQLAKNLFLTHDRTLSRKIQEALLTLQLERKFTKEEILEKYLNTIYFGHSAYGVEAASRTYFNKPAKDLTLAEAALLAGIPRGPAYYSPYISEATREASKRRQEHVLARMAEERYISAAQKEEAARQPLVFEGRDNLQAARQFAGYFIDYLINTEIPKKIDGFDEDPMLIFRGGLHIYTTLDKQMQQAAESTFANPQFLPPATSPEPGVTVPLQAALVALDPADGSVRALMGGRDYKESQYNFAVNRRSPGSAFKVFTFAAALEAGLTPAAIRESAPVAFPQPGKEPYEPTEYGTRFYGPLRMREAIARSSNIVAIKLHDEIGLDKSVEMAKRLGITSPVEPVLSLPLGTSWVSPLEMAASYIPFANQGIRVEPQFITRITDSRGRVLYNLQSVRRTPVLDPQIAYLMTDMMKNVLQPGGTGSQLGPRLNRPAAGKTGTSQGHRDSYMVGFTPDLVTAVWVGNRNNLSLGWGQTGSVRAGTIWAQFMNNALRDAPPRDFPRPGGLVAMNICPATGLLHNSTCSLTPVRELFIAGTEPKEQCRWPVCPHCPPEQQWHWNGGWWNRHRIQRQPVPDPPEPPEVLPPDDYKPLYPALFDE